MNAFTLLAEADDVDKATGYNGILKPFFIKIYQLLH